MMRDARPAVVVRVVVAKTHAAAYRMYRIGCGRDRRLHELSGTRE